MKFVLNLTPKVKLFLGIFLALLVLGIAFQQPNKELFREVQMEMEHFKTNACDDSKRSLPLSDFHFDFASNTPDFRLPA